MVYTLIKTEKSYCPQCKQSVNLLCDNPNAPSLYICFPCEWVEQIGVGPVMNESLNEVNDKESPVMENQRSFYRLYTVDIDKKKDLHFFEAGNHADAVVHAASYINESGRSIWSAKLISSDGALMLDGDDQFIGEEKVLAENQTFMEQELGIYNLELGKEAYDLFKNLYELSHENKDLLAALVLLKKRYEQE